MKTISFFLLALAIALVSSCAKSKCGTIIKYDYYPTMEQYFGMYKPGNWWVYKTPDSTKTDSLYIGEYREEKGEGPGHSYGGIVPKKIECREFTERGFNFYSKYITEGNKVNCYYSSDITNDVATFFTAEMGVNDKYPKSYNSPEVLDSLTVNHIVYKKVIVLKDYHNYTVYIAPAVGMVKCITPYHTTFLLSKYYIK
jgi:hypothetical protein